MIKGTQGRLEFHRYQICEGIRNDAESELMPRNLYR